MELSKTRVYVDKVSDFIPIVSTINSAIDFAQKNHFLIEKINSTSANDSTPNINERYYIHLNKKSDLRGLITLVPFLGNAALAVGLAGQALFKFAKTRIQYIRSIPLDKVNEKIKGNANYVLKRVVKHPHELHYAPGFASNKKFIKVAVKRNPEVFAYAAQELKSDREFYHELMTSAANSRNCESIYSYVSDEEKQKSSQIAECIIRIKKEIESPKEKG